MLRTFKTLGVGLSLAGALLLGGCLAADTSPSEPFALASLAVEKQYVAPGCQGEQCSTVTISAGISPGACVKRGPTNPLAHPRHGDQRRDGCPCRELGRVR